MVSFSENQQFSYFLKTIPEHFGTFVLASNFSEFLVEWKEPLVSLLVWFVELIQKHF